MSKALLWQLIKWVAIALLALVLYGVVPGGHLAVVAGLFVGVRLCFIGAEALRKPMTMPDWQTRAEKLTRVAERLNPDQRCLLAAERKLAPDATTRQIVDAEITQALRRYRPPRGRGELVAESLGVVGLVALAPASVALFTSDFFSLRLPLTWVGALVLAAGAALYGWPHAWPRSVHRTRRRILWWAVPFLPAVWLVVAGVGWRHPYLNPFHPDHLQLAAERVLALQNNVVAGRHADWVLRYARRLDARGDSGQAAFYYREALRLDANDPEVAARLAALENQARRVGARPRADAAIAPKAPYWAEEPPAGELPRRRIDSPQLENIDECSVLLIPVGEVAEPMLRAAGHVVRQELGLPVYIAEESVPLPEHTRVRGLVTGRQWSCDSLVRALLARHPRFPKAPIKYVLVTSADIYTEGAQFVFSGAAEWGALVSVARLGGPAGDSRAACHRAAKQVLCAVLKSFKMPVSPDRACVTSYSRTLEEFDAKGNRPSAETLAGFQRAVTELNRQWRPYKATK